MTEVELSEFVRNWAIVVGGAFGIMIAGWRGWAADQQARAARKQSMLVERDQVTETFNRAVGQLRDDRVEVRLGAIATLKMIFERPQISEFDQPIIDVLSAYVRERSSESETDTPSMDIQDTMDFLEYALSDQAN